MTCASRKRLPVPERLRIRALRHVETEGRAREWIDRLRAEPAETRPARYLYGGDHWQTALSIEAEGPGCSLAVVSAGYGLIDPDSAVKPYSATFSPGPDSVTGRGAEVEVRRKWWNHLADDPPSAGAHPHSLQELAASEPQDIFLVALSAPYLEAVQQDLVMAAQQLNSASQLILISSSGTASAEGMDGRIPISVDWQHALGGSRLSLNVRMARHLVRCASDHGWNRNEIAQLLSNPPRSVDRHAAPRVRVTDDEVVAFIKAARRSAPSISKSRLLRGLRESGYACEQGRMGALFHRAAEQ